MEWKERQQEYRRPTGETLMYLSSRQGYELAVGLAELYRKTMPRAWGLALAQETETFNRWKVVVSAIHRGVSNIELISSDTGLTEKEVESVLDTVGSSGVAVVLEVAGRAEYCRRACLEAPNFQTCFNNCMKGGQQTAYRSAGI
jgi:hypothetical protein